VPRISLEIVSCGGLLHPAVIGRTLLVHAFDDDDEWESYVRPLLQLETVTSMVICSDKQFSFVLKYLARVRRHLLEPLVLGLQLNKQETLNTSMPTLKPTHHER